MLYAFVFHTHAIGPTHPTIFHLVVRIPNIWRGIRSTKVFTVQFFSSLLYVPFAVPEVQDVFGDVTEV